MNQTEFKNVFHQVCRMFYMQRCGCRLPEQLAGVYAHPACHISAAKVYGTEQFADVSGGWHDAGDYGRYVVPAAKAVTDLLLAYTAAPSAFSGSLDIHDSASGVPDILTEMRYELDWMKKMQRQDGGVYHKVTCADFPGFVMPQFETDELVISPVSTAAAGGFAAAMAMAYRVYSDFDLAFAQGCLTAARRAWDYLSVTQPIPFHNPDGIITGFYDDENDSDERYWAACALYAATGSGEYHDYIKSHYNPAWAGDLGWADVGAYGSAVYLGMDERLQDVAIKSAIERDLLKAADHVVQATDSSEYSISVSDFIWGSNMVVMNNAMLLLMANDIQQRSEYISCAWRHIDYIFGDNPMSVCYVTGVSESSARRPHHRPSVATGQTMPGMLVGGPDQYLHDACASQHLRDSTPPCCYIDHAESYSTNEVAIYWNSPLVYVMARLLDTNNPNIAAERHFNRKRS